MLWPDNAFSWWSLTWPWTMNLQADSRTVITMQASVYPVYIWKPMPTYKLKVHAILLSEKAPHE